MMNRTGQSEEKIDVDTEERKKWERKGTIFQLTMCLCANFTVVGPAMAFGYSAIALPFLTSPKSELKINEHEASWIASITAMVTPVGCIMCGFIMRRGRKISFLLISGVSLTAWIILFMSANFGHILIGRALSGIATGLSSVSCTVYCAEVSSPKLRGTVVTWTSLSIASGVLIVYIFGYYFPSNWRLVALLCAVFPIVAFVTTVMVLTESPIWLREHGRLDEACQTLKKFRGVPENAPLPPDLLIELHGKPQKKKQHVLKHLLKRTSLVPLAIMLGFFFFQQFSGLFVLVFYAVDITKEAGVTADAYLVAILIGFTRLVGSILVSATSNKFGRRISAITSGIGMSVFMGILSFYLFEDYRDDNGLIPAVCILAYIFTSTLGFLVLPFAMVGELYPAKVKDILSGITTSAAYIFSSIAIKTYPDLLEHLGKAGVFLFYAVLSLAGTVFVFFFLPETKGKTLQEIEELYAKKRKTDVEESAEKEKIVPLNDLTEAQFREYK